jgi:hypothetical protein
MMTDNKGLLTLFETSLPYPDPLPNNTLLANWDVTHQISQMLRQTSVIPWLKHIKGHQDNKTPYIALSLKAQLKKANVDKEASNQVIYQ